jgi:hypothetical protein
MARFFQKLTQNLEKFFSLFPHIPKKFLKIFLPIIPWYIFLKGLINIIRGLRSLSASFQFGSLPMIFNKLIEANPIFLFWNGVLLLFISLLYFAAFTNLAQKKTQYMGWQNWFQTALISTAINLFQVIFFRNSIFWITTKTIINWYLIFEFLQFYKSSTKKK